MILSSHLYLNEITLALLFPFFWVHMWGFKLFNLVSISKEKKKKFKLLTFWSAIIPFLVDQNPKQQ